MLETRFRSWVCILFTLALVGFTEVNAQISRKPAARRFLFVIETSSDTKKAADTIQQSVNALLETGMGETMVHGDTFGVWTFNSELHLGEFPMQRWMTNGIPETQKRVENFLKSRRYEKSPKLENVLPKLNSVIQSSPTIVVALLTSGSRAITNTPFDAEINAFFKQHYREYQKEKMPFVTMLLAHEGKILRHSVSSPFEIKVPKLPPQPEPEKKLEIAAASAKPAVETNSPPIAKASQPEPVAPRGTQALVIGKGGAQLVSATNEGVSLEEEVEKALIAKSVPKATAVQQMVNPPAEPQAALAENVKLPSDSLVETLENKSEPVPEPVRNVAASVKIEPVPPHSESESTLSKAPEVPVEKPVSPAPVKPQPVEAAAAAPVVKIPVEAPKAAEKTQTLAVATAPSGSGGSNGILFLGGILFALALMFAFWLGRTTAKPPTPSFITQSVERAEKK